MKTNTADVLAKIGEALERLATDLSAGRPESLTKYLRSLALFHQYSYGNALLIALQKPDATLVAGFRKWKKMGRHVRKGEKGMAILVPIFPGSTRKQKQREVVVVEHDQPIKLTELDDEVSHFDRPVTFRVGHVFDISQTDGEPIPDPFVSKGNAKKDDIALMEDGIRKTGATLKYETLTGAYGTNHDHIITVDPKWTGVMRLQTLAHEWAHYILHRDSTLPKKTEEMEAEASAVALCAALGYDVEPTGLNYLSHYGITPEELKDSLVRIHAAIHTMLEAMSL